MTFRRIAFTVLLAIGVVLIVAPISMSMFSRTSAGEQTVDTFRPIMQPTNVRTTADYYDSVFTKLRPIALMMNDRTLAKFDGYLAGMKGMQTDAARLVPALAQALHTTPAQVQQMLAAEFPSMAKMLQALPQMSSDFGGLMTAMKNNVPVFERVPPGLDHYKPLVQTMEANVDNYAAIDAMPRMSLFPWFFVAPGILIVLVAGVALLHEWRPGALHVPTFHRPVPH